MNIKRGGKIISYSLIRIYYVNFYELGGSKIIYFLLYPKIPFSLDYDVKGINGTLFLEFHLIENFEHSNLVFILKHNESKDDSFFNIKATARAMYSNFAEADTLTGSEDTLDWSEDTLDWSEDTLDWSEENATLFSNSSRNV